MKNFLVIICGIIMVLASNYLGYIKPPFSINFTPILLGFFTALVLYFTNFQIVIKFILITVMIISNDVLIKLFAGGTHDMEGLGGISVFLFFGLIISLILIIIEGIVNQKNKRVKYFLCLLGASIIISAYLFCFETLGLVK